MGLANLSHIVDKCARPPFPNGQNETKQRRLNSGACLFVFYNRLLSNDYLLLGCCALLSRHFLFALDSSSFSLVCVRAWSRVTVLLPFPEWRAHTVIVGPFKKILS